MALLIGSNQKVAHVRRVVCLCVFACAPACIRFLLNTFYARAPDFANMLQNVLTGPSRAVASFCVLCATMLTCLRLLGSGRGGVSASGTPQAPKINLKR